jgi:hypothetical protein
VDSVRPLDQKNASMHTKPLRQTAQEVKADQQRAREFRQQAASEIPRLTDAQLAKAAARKLYLLLPSRATAEQVKELCAQHPGDVPVYMKLSDEGIVLLLSRDHWCSPEPALLGNLRRMYGKDGVVLKE